MKIERFLSETEFCFLKNIRIFQFFIETLPKQETIVTQSLRSRKYFTLLMSKKHIYFKYIIVRWFVLC